MRADTDQARAEREQRLRERCVHLGKTDENGLRTVFARIDAGSAAWLDAVLERVADILAERPDLIPDLVNRPHPPSRDELRAEAMGWLPHPEDLLALLTGTYPHPDQPQAQPETQPEPPGGTRGEAVLYVHLHQGAVDGTIAPDQVIVRVEGLGPMLLEDLYQLLRHAHVTVVPVVDLNQTRSVNGYEHPPDVSERTFLRMTGDVFPHATSQSRRR